MKSFLLIACQKLSWFAIALILSLGISLCFDNSPALADYFNCFQSGNCTAPALSNSTTCKKDTDYKVTVSDKGSPITILSFHGGKIELNTSAISAKLQELTQWNRYDLNADATSTCLDGLTNFQRLHITSTNFDDTNAVNLVQKYPKSVAIHGYNRDYPNGTICVGGANSTQVQTFINKVNERKSLFKDYDLIPVNAPAINNKTDHCFDLKGTFSSNIVNRNSTSKGLQLEMSQKLREDLVNTGYSSDILRRIIYDSIMQAMKN